MSVLDSTFDFFVRSFKIRSRELPAEPAIAAARELTRFFAVELNYKGQPIRLIVAASRVPEELNPKPSTAAAPELTPAS